MSKRTVMLKGSSILLLSLAYGCANTVPVGTQSAVSGPQMAGSGLISNNAGGLISNNAGGLISNNAGGLISNNAGGLISNNAGGLISNNAGGLISNNAGGLSGAIKGPSAGLISNNAGGLISNNAGGLISNNAGGLISNNAGGLISNNAGGLISNAAGGYHITSVADSAAVPNAKVAVFNERGEMVSYSWTVTDKNGGYTFKRLKPSGPMLFVKAVYTLGGQQVNLMAAAKAPRDSGGVSNVTVNPATTLIAKKVQEMVRLRVVSVAAVKPEATQTLADKVAPLMSDKAIYLASTLPANEVAKTFDNFVADPAAPPTLKTTLAAEVPAAPAVLNPTPVDVAVDASAGPGNTSNGLNTGTVDTSSSTGSTSTSTTTTTTTTTSGGTTTTTTSGTTTPSTMPADVSTIAGLTINSGVGIKAATGSNTLYIANSTGKGQPSKLTATDATTAVAGTVAGSGVLAFSFSGTTAYVMTASQIAKEDGTGAVALDSAVISSPTDFAVVGTNAYVTSEANDVIYKVDLTTGTASVFAGQNGLAGFADGSGTAAKFWYPRGITFDSTTNALYVADSGNGRIRKLALNAAVTTFAGNGSGSSADGTGIAAGFKKPYDITTDGAGTFYVADYGANKIRKVAATADVTTIAGNGNLASNDGTGDVASFYLPASITFGKVAGQDILWVGDLNAVRTVTGW